MRNIIAILVILTLTACASKKEYDPTPKRNGSSDKFMTYLLAKDYTLATSMFSRRLQRLVPASSLKKSWSKQLKALGTPISFEQVNRGVNTDFIKVTFEKYELPINLHYNNGVIDDLQIKQEHMLRKNAIEVKTFDNNTLSAVISAPKIPQADVKKVVIFIHGSGPSDMDESSSELFKRISRDLTAKKIASIRYNKRSYKKLRLEHFGDDTSKVASSDFSANFLSYFIKDAESMITLAKNRYPNAKIVLFGKGQGSYIALQLANLNKSINGIVLLGSYNKKINEVLLEQNLYNHTESFHKLDKNGDKKLSRKEYRRSRRFYSQSKAFDLNNDGNLSLNEFKAVRYTHVLKSDSIYSSWFKQELNYPSPIDIIKSTNINTLFIHGVLDNRTPVYFPMSLKLMNDKSWKKENLHFKFYKGLGHSLNPKRKYMENSNKKAPRNILKNLAREIEWI